MLFLAYSFLLLAFLLFMMNVTDRFLKYVGYGTQSDPNTGLNPSTPGQMEFAHVLKEEMEAIGIQEVELDEFGYRVYRPYGYQPRNEWQACEPPDYRELCGQ